MAGRVCDVKPGQDSAGGYSIALIDSSGRWYGFNVDLTQMTSGAGPISGGPGVIERALNAPPPQQKIEMLSWHMGRGAEKWLPKDYKLFDTQDAWTSTLSKFHPTMKWRFAKGIRSEDRNLPDSMTFKPLYPSGASGGPTQYLDVSFVASATYSMTNVWLWIRKHVVTGSSATPGTLTVEIDVDSSGNPGAVQKSMTTTYTVVTDTVSQFLNFIPASAFSASSGTTYHIKIYGSAGDTADSCWEVGCDTGTAGLSSTNNSTWSSTTFSPCYRITDADTNRQFIPFEFDSGFYAVTKNANTGTADQLWINGARGKATSATSTTLVDTKWGQWTVWTTSRWVNAYIRIIRGTGVGQIRLITANNTNSVTVATWDVTPDTTSEYVIYSTDWWVQITGTGFGQITGKPVVSNGICYFPLGDSTTLRRMQMDYTTTQEHAFAVETVVNRMVLMTPGYVSADGPQLWRANNALTSGGAPNGLAVSVGRASTSPAGTPIGWGTDLTFKTSITCGDNTHFITNIWEHLGKLYVCKEDTLYVIDADKALNVKVGIESAPSTNNGRAIITATDGNLYVNFSHDVLLISGTQAMPTGLNSDAGLPSNRSGYIADMESRYGWLFGALDAGTSNFSSIVKYSLDTKTWSEQVRAPAVNYRIRSVRWQSCQLTRPRLWYECGGDLLYQEFPLDNTRPITDTGLAYMHESVFVSQTFDMGTTDAKYFSRLFLTTSNLSMATDAEPGSQIVCEYQYDNDINTSNWQYAGTFTLSPIDVVEIAKGSIRKLRIRLRLLTADASEPPIIENLKLSLFSRTEIYHEYQFSANIETGDDEQKNSDIIDWLKSAVQNAQVMELRSSHTEFHGRRVILKQESRFVLDDYDAAVNDVSGFIVLDLTEVV